MNSKEIRKARYQHYSNVREQKILHYKKINDAGYAVAQAIKSGKLVKKPCEVCGANKTEAHHEDYDKPLDVKWLCSTHHRQRHKELRGGLGFQLSFQRAINTGEIIMEERR